MKPMAPLISKTIDHSRRSRRPKIWSLGVALCVLSFTSQAWADRGTIKVPGQHPDYSFEAEPHVLAEPFHDFHPGLGFRGTIELVDNGFISKINNTVGIGFGADWTRHNLWLPVVMQWNFWLTENWSVFGEPGLVLRITDDKRHGADFFAIYAGGRFRLTESITLTGRVGRPSASLGVSFLL
jgi:hypothetical protein